MKNPVKRLFPNWTKYAGLRLYLIGVGIYQQAFTSKARTCCAKDDNPKPWN